MPTRTNNADQLDEMTGFVAIFFGGCGIHACTWQSAQRVTRHFKILGSANVMLYCL